MENETYFWIVFYNKLYNPIATKGVYSVWDVNIFSLATNLTEKEISIN